MAQASSFESREPQPRPTALGGWISCTVPKNILIPMLKSPNKLLFFVDYTFSHSMSSSREPRVSKPSQIIADPSNAAKPVTSSLRAAVAAAGAQCRITLLTAATQNAADNSPEITPPPSTPVWPTTSTTNKRPPSPSVEDVKAVNELGGRSMRQSKGSSKQIIWFFCISCLTYIWRWCWWWRDA